MYQNVTSLEYLSSGMVEIDSKWNLALRNLSSTFLDIIRIYYFFITINTVQIVTNWIPVKNYQNKLKLIKLLSDKAINVDISCC